MQQLPFVWMPVQCLWTQIQGCCSGCGLSCLGFRFIVWASFVRRLCSLSRSRCCFCTEGCRTCGCLGKRSVALLHFCWLCPAAAANCLSLLALQFAYRSSPSMKEAPESCQSCNHRTQFRRWALKAEILSPILCSHGYHHILYLRMR